MKNIKQFVIGVAAGIVLLGLLDSLLGFIGLALLVIGIIYWAAETNKKKVG